ncbi:MAG: hypothetical protein J0I49_22445 [Pseudonocardia sp.]|uniref:hypothetical protein n=1 Tax=Pseudonocardia sp. TaxID=60912 RepID=UPI001AD4C9A5|nr:hypothetical protein [Pseudonocardia sp.]MBN9100847.1 hypothetical protein [Pseudonocardia sp.]
MSRTLLRPVLAAGAAVVVAVLALLLVGAAGALQAPPSSDPPLGAALSDEDRAALGAVPAERGAPPAAADPGVDLTDPEAVARAYLAAAHSVAPGDAGRTQLRAAGYAVPGSTAAAVGVVVLDPPPAGSLRTATVTALELVAADAGGTRRGYRAEVGTATGPPGGALAVDLVTSRIVLARQADGRWLVAAETPDLPTGED